LDPQENAGKSEYLSIEEINDGARRQCLPERETHPLAQKRKEQMTK
jgi:hypothetical protein